MKMDQQTYGALRADIKAVSDASGVRPPEGDKLRTMFDLLAVVSRCRAYDDSHPGFQQQHWTRYLPYDRRDYCWYYAGGLHDEHVATALRHIKAELFPE